MNLFEKHQPVIAKAIEALHARTFYAAFPENPSPATYGETADADGQAKFKLLPEIKLVRNQGFKVKEVKEIIQLTIENSEHLIQKWHETFNP